MSNWNEAYEVAKGKVDPACGFKVGDLIFAYHSGVHTITEIKRRRQTYRTHDRLGETINDGDPDFSLLQYKKVLDKSGNPSRSKPVNTCHPHYCTKIDKKVVEQKRKDELKKVKAKWTNIGGLL